MRTTICLLDPFAGGHHATYLAQFSEELCALGCQVCTVSPSPVFVDDKSLSWEKWTLQSVPRKWSERRQLWSEAAARVTRLERSTGQRIDLTFFAMLDPFIGHGFTRRQVALRFPRPFAGLLLHPWMFRLPIRARWMRKLWLNPLESLHASTCRAVVTLDSGVIVTLRRALRKPVIELPDVAHTALSAQPCSLAAAIRVKAGQRYIVSLLGVIDGRKGLGRFFAAAQAADSAKWLFVIAGAVVWETLSVSEAHELRRWMLAPPAAGWVAAHESLKNEEDINAVIECSFAVWLSYERFPYSSNLLTKCAALRVPVISNGEYLIGERVREFELGLVLPSGKETAFFSGPTAGDLIRSLKDTRTFADGCGRFSAQQSRSRLRAALSEMVDSSNLETQMVAPHPS